MATIEPRTFKFTYTISVVDGNKIVLYDGNTEDLEYAIRWMIKDRLQRLGYEKLGYEPDSISHTFDKINNEYAIVTIFVLCHPRYNLKSLELKLRTFHKYILFITSIEEIIPEEIKEPDCI